MLNLAQNAPPAGAVQEPIQVWRTQAPSTGLQRLIWEQFNTWVEPDLGVVQGMGCAQSQPPQSQTGSAQAACNSELTHHRDSWIDKSAQDLAFGAGVAQGFVGPLSLKQRAYCVLAKLAQQSMAYAEPSEPELIWLEPPSALNGLSDLNGPDGNTTGKDRAFDAKQSEPVAQGTETIEPKASRNSSVKVSDPEKVARTRRSRKGTEPVSSWMPFVQRTLLIHPVWHWSWGIDWRDVVWGCLHARAVRRWDLQDTSFVVPLIQSGLLPLLQEQGVLTGLNARLLRKRNSRHAQLEMIEGLDFVELQAALFVHTYWTIVSQGKFLGQVLCDEAISRQLGCASLYPEPTTDCSDLMEQLRQAVMQNLQGQVPAVRVGALRHMADQANKTACPVSVSPTGSSCATNSGGQTAVSRAVLTLPLPQTSLYSQDDTLNPKRAALATWGEEFLVQLDAHMRQLLASADCGLVGQAYRYSLMACGLLSCPDVKQALATPFKFSYFPLRDCQYLRVWLDAKEQSAQSQLLLDTRSSLLLLRLQQLAKQQHTGMDSPSQILESFKATELNRRLFEALQLSEKAKSVMSQWPLLAMGGAMQTRLPMIVLTFLTNRKRFTQSLPTLSQTAISEQALGSSQAQRVTPSTLEDSGQVLQAAQPTCDEDPQVSGHTSMSFKPWLELAHGPALRLGQALANWQAKLESNASAQIKGRACPIVIKATQTLEKQLAEWVNNPSNNSDGVVLDEALKDFTQYLIAQIKDWLFKQQAGKSQKAANLAADLTSFLAAFHSAWTEQELQGSQWSDVACDSRTATEFYFRLLSPYRGKPTVERKLALQIQAWDKSHQHLRVDNVFVDVDELDVPEKGQAATRVHYIEPGTYQEVLQRFVGMHEQALRQEIGAVQMALICESKILAHILLYRLALRRGELLALTHSDVQWAGFNTQDHRAGVCQITLRGGHLKSASGTRVMTLTGLLTDEEMQWVHARKAQLWGQPNLQRPFLHKAGVDDKGAQTLIALTVNDLQALVVQLAEVCVKQASMGMQDTFTLHSYRHSAINNWFVWLTMGLLSEHHVQIAQVSQLPFMRGQEFCPARVELVVASLRGLPLNSARLYDYDVANELIRAAGHLNFRTTRTTYLHLMNWAAVAFGDLACEFGVSGKTLGVMLGLKGKANKRQREHWIQEFGLKGAIVEGAPSARVAVAELILRHKPSVN